jgi:pantoate--beta-alanine ligase
MEIIRIPTIMRQTSHEHLKKGKTIGFVPTMGALHEGHLSLVRRAKQENDITTVSIFVNPIQFGPSEDFERYPRDREGDLEKLQKEKTDVTFIPEISSMYPERFLTHIEVNEISGRLCGAFRPNHFRGVATVVTKLLNIVKPTRVYFGQKDFQQSVIIKQLVRDLDIGVDVVVCPTVREQDGLAMSSRNTYLSEEQRKAATVIYECLREASDLVKSGIVDGIFIKGFMQERILNVPGISSVDYAGVYNPETMIEMSEINGDILLAIALKIGNTRLIDNMLVTGLHNIQNRLLSKTC